MTRQILPIEIHEFENRASWHEHFEKTCLRSRVNRLNDVTVAVFEIVPYSLPHYALYSVHDIVHYIGNEQTRIRTLR